MKLMRNATGNPNGADVEPINPYELIDLCLQYDMDAFSDLFGYYIKVFLGIYKEHSLKCCGMTRKEWLCECSSVLWECIFRYRPDLQILFSALLRSSLNNRALSIRRSFARKQDPLYGSPLSLDQMLDESIVPYHDNQKDVVHDAVLGSLEIEYVLTTLKKSLSEEEFRVVTLLYEGFRKSEVGRIMGWTKYQVNCALAKSRQVLLVDTQYTD